MTNVILEQTYKIISWHNHPNGKCKCTCADLCTLKRLLDKKLYGDKHGDASKYSFSESEITSETQKRTVGDLKLLTGHTRDSPYNPNGALVIVNYKGKDLLLDGNNRVNYWHAKGDMFKEIEVNYHHIVDKNSLHTNNTPPAVIGGP